MKRCTKCKESKSLDQFSPDKRNRSGVQSQCKSCQRAYKEAHRDNERSYQAGRRKDNPERERIRLQKWRNANPEKAREQYRRTHQNNKAKRNRYSLTHWRIYYTSERSQVYGERRRARKRAIGGRFTYDQWRLLKATYDHTCLSCFRSEPEIKLTIDHVVPLSCGGSNDITNIQPLCSDCNNRKRAQTVDYRKADTS